MITRDTLLAYIETLRQQEIDGRAKAEQSFGARIFAEYLLSQLPPDPEPAANQVPAPPAEG